MRENHERFFRFGLHQLLNRCSASLSILLTDRASVIRIPNLFQPGVEIRRKRHCGILHGSSRVFDEVEQQAIGRRMFVDVVQNAERVDEKPASAELIAAQERRLRHSRRVEYPAANAAEIFRPGVS